MKILPRNFIDEHKVQKWLDIKKLGKPKPEWINGILDEEPYDSYFVLVDDNIVGTGSVVYDDKKTGEDFNLTGIWIGGIFIDEEYRNKGYASNLLSYIVKKLILYVDKYKITVRVNLIANKPNAERIYMKNKFTKIKNFEIDRDGIKYNVYFRNIVSIC